MEKDRDKIVLTPDSKVGKNVDAVITRYEALFIQEFINSGDLGASIRRAEKECGIKHCNHPVNCAQRGAALLNRPKIQKEIKRIMAKIEKETIMTGKEVLEYFSAVVRGEIKDQFGLDPSLADRTKAAQELAKRTIDIEQKLQQAEAGNTITVNLNWDRQ